MSKIEIAGIQSNLSEELDDADLMAVVGGGLVDNVTGTVANSGNNSTPTSSGIKLVGDTVSAAGGYISNNGAGFAENVLQGTNKTLVDGV